MQVNRPDWPNQSVGDQFGLQFDAAPEPERLTSGFQHDVWRVATTTGPIVLKNQVERPTGISFALERAARVGGVMTAQIIDPLEGDTPWIRDEQTNGYIRAHQFIPGTTFDRQPVPYAIARQLGGQLAKLHTVGYRLLESYPLAPSRLDGPDDDTTFDRAVTASIQDFRNVLKSDAKKHVIGHRDIAGKNIIADADNTVHLIDFDETGLTTVEGDIVDAAFNVAGVHSPQGAQENVVRSFLRGYREVTKYDVQFDRDSFHMLIGMSEWWWLQECKRRIASSTGDTSREQSEVQRLTTQLPRDIASIPRWLPWLEG